MAILLKTASVRVSSIQIMQVRVRNKGKSVWKSRYVGDVSTPPSLNLCLSSSNSVDKLKVIKKNLYKLCLILLLQICKANIQVFSKDHELTTFTITFRSHIYSYQWHNQLASNNNKSWMTTLSQNNHDMIWQGGISLALSETTKHKCRAPLKIKDWLDIAIHGKRDLVIVILNVN